MARAFTEKERIEIKEKIMETALDLFHDKGTKSLNIQELTKRVGISQGSFYNFWKDKETLIVDLIAYRSNQKLNMIEKEFSGSLKDPIRFLTDIIYNYFMDLMVKIETQEIYKDSFKIFSSKEKGDVNRVETLYGEFLKKLINYWMENDVVEKADERGLSNAFIVGFLLCSNSYHFDKNYFAEILETYIYSIVSKYIEYK